MTIVITNLKLVTLMTPFLLVRHPFIRLVSAYEDKMLNPRPGMKYHKTVQEERKRRSGKDAEHRIVFPSHLLMTEMYQLMLRRKVKLYI